MTPLEVAGQFTLASATANFIFWSGQSGFKKGSRYVLLKASELNALKAIRFGGNSLNKLEPHLRVEDDELSVTFLDPSDSV